MYKKYGNFVKSSSYTDINELTQLSGDEARRIYLEEIKDVGASTVSVIDTKQPKSQHTKRKQKHKQNTSELHLSAKELLQTAENNDIDTLIRALDTCPDKINIQDEFGWSLLMIACQANSIETVRELIKRGIDTSVRDKAGNSAQSLVIKNKNFVLAEILLSNIQENIQESKPEQKQPKVKRKEKYTCQLCNKEYSGKDKHLSSTIHNLNASKGRRIPTQYVIPQSNRGYQIMLKVGWDKETGLGPDGTGNKYPIRAVQKKDRKGLGQEKKKNIPQEDKVKDNNRKIVTNNLERNRRMEINFRREFY